jgi:CheY-like chemotaxis protein
MPGDRKYLVMLGDDVTRSKELQIERNRLYVENDLNLNRLTSFTHLLSHQLRHQYASLQTFLSLANKAESSKELFDQQLGLLSGITSELSSVMAQLDFVLFGEKQDGSPSKLIKSESLNVARLKKVILIDDDKIINTLHRLHLRREYPGLQVDVFQHPHEAKNYIERAENSNDSLILLDLNMPECSGWEFLDGIQHLPDNFVIYILSSSHNPEDIVKSSTYPSKVKGYLTKPLSIDSFKTLLIQTRVELIANPS